MHVIRSYHSCLLLAALAAGCATPPPPSPVPNEVVAPAPENVPVVRYGRYTLVELTPTAVQQDLLLQVVDVPIPSTLHASVGDALRHVLQRSGYQLCSGGDIDTLGSLPLPAAHYHLGPLQLRDALLTLAGVLVVLLAVIIIPSSYLAQVQGYRPIQTAPIMLLMAAPQLIALPLVAALCNLRWVDCRWVLGIGLSMLALSCIGGSHLTSVWIRDDFYVLQLLQIFGQPMSVLPLLMLSTGSISPLEGPFASAWFNTVKGLAAVIATGVLEALTTARLHFHSTMLVDSLGNSPLVNGDSATLARRLHQQAVVLTSSDLYLCMAGVALALILLIFWLPTRIYPPRAPT